MTWKRNTGPANRARRGQRINQPGPAWPKVRHALHLLARDHPNGKSIADLARSLHTSRKTVWRWMSGKHWPTRRTVEAIQRYLDA